MSEYNIYKDIAERTGGDVYLGVVGPVRTGKSTFIKKFMDLFVIPNMEDENEIQRANDELPQSAGGKTIMTTEPKFIPNEAVEINATDAAKMRVRLIDCVGYIVPQALGHTEDGKERLVNTPWSEEPMEFGKAAEIGTKKVICDHSTIGLLVTTDGSITDIARDDYVEAEARVANELTAQGKPFVIILNTRYPTMPETEELRAFLSQKYNAPVVAVNCLELDDAGIKKILEQVLMSFPVTEIAIKLPEWVEALHDDHDIKNVLFSNCFGATQNVATLNDLEYSLNLMCQCDYVDNASISNIDLGCGKAEIEITVPKDLYYKVVREISGFDVYQRNYCRPFNQNSFRRFRIQYIRFFNYFYRIITGDNPVMLCHISHSHKYFQTYSIHCFSVSNKMKRRIYMCAVVSTHTKCRQIVQFTFFH